jgi:hypothetical protein
MKHVIHVLCILSHHFFARLVLVFAFLVPRFLLLFLPLLPKREEVVNALQTNAHSGAIPNSFSSSESSQLHGGAGLGVLAIVAIVAVVGMAPEGTNTNGETKCLRSAIDCVD